ncbi:unnamed protein product, partial [Symbiodinium sp. CCMP2456]
ESMLVADTETGRVTAVKLAPADNESSTVLTLERTSGSGTMSVVVPQDLLQNLSTGGNTIMVMTEVTEEVTRGIPTGAETGDKVVLHSPVVDFSFVNEVSGTLRLVEVNGSVPIGFTITNRPPVPGERCSYFDPVLDAWSDAGMELVNGSYIDGADGANVSWCVTTHTSMFALIQSLPLDLLHESDDNSLQLGNVILEFGNVSGYMAAIGVTLGMVFILCVMTLRRLAESKSQFELKEDGDSGDEDGQDPRESEFFYEDFCRKCRGTGELGN